ncbi:copper chaperone PCu(A)C [Humitalea sp. 24SJ18S-53]|uniref:copper chaperone PCu(A)C n=1 Tax=Humitalea sp. 24SJ18S-53 TaxID=3422307 RepID=UPI003D66E08F
MLIRRALIASALALPFVAQTARAHDYTVGDIAIGHPWSRAAVAGGTGAGFMTLRSTGAGDRLLSASSPAARTVELHTAIRDGEVMRMRPVTDIPVAAGQSVTLAPGGFHIMLIGLTQPMAAGSRVPLTLRFERGGEVTVELAVERAGAPAAAGAHQH